jgi:hypothetical protein
MSTCLETYSAVLVRFSATTMAAAIGWPAAQLWVPKSTYDYSKGIPNVGQTLWLIVLR